MPKRPFRRGSSGTLGSIAVLAGLLLFAPARAASPPASPSHSPSPPPPEKHLANVRQITRGGSNAEAYFSYDGRRVIFQSTRPPFECDQIFTTDLEGRDVRLVSTGKGRTTCAFFFPDGKRFVYASTHLGGDACPPKPDRSRGYAWPLYPTYDVFQASAESGEVRRLTTTSGYDAECAVSPDGRRIVFTSVRDGDLDIYLMNADGTGVRRLTSELGYDGGPFFSWDGRSIVYRALRPGSDAEAAQYRSLLAQALVKPTHAEIMLMAADGSGKRRITNNGAANWAPFLHPDNRRIVFSSNLHDPNRRSFSLYLVNTDGTGLQRITFAAAFDAFPMFSRDGKKLIFASSRNGKHAHEFNIFVADWVD